METKICSQCNKEKPKTSKYFEIRNDSKDGFRNVCRECRNNRKRIIYKEKHKTSNNIWSDYEIKVLIDNYENMSNKDIIKTFNLTRTSNQITDYANKKLNLHKNKEEMLKKPLKVEKDNDYIETKRDIWTIEEDTFIKKYFSQQDKKFILNGLQGRTWEAIRNRGIKLGIKRIREWSKEEEKILIDNYPNKTLKELQYEFFKEKDLNAINSKTRVLKLFKSEEYLKQHRSGENNNCWRGGISTLSNYIRNNIEKWVKDSFSFYKGKCVITGETNNLELHHLYPFNKILRETLKELNLDILKTIGEYSSNELNNIIELCLKKHYEYGYGIPLKKELHIKFHKNYGKINFNKNDFLKFCKDNNYYITI